MECVECGSPISTRGLSAEARVKLDCSPHQVAGCADRIEFRRNGFDPFTYTALPGEQGRIIKSSSTAGASIRTRPPGFSDIRLSWWCRPDREGEVVREWDALLRGNHGPFSFVVVRARVSPLRALGRKRTGSSLDCRPPAACPWHGRLEPSFPSVVREPGPFANLAYPRGVLVVSRCSTTRRRAIVR